MIIKENREYLVDVTVSYFVTSEELREIYEDFDELDNMEQSGLAENYVREKLFDTEDLNFVCVENYEV
jgi:hypothetical protein